MAPPTAGEYPTAGVPSQYERAKEIKAFDDSKLGVKGLVDAGVVKVPKYFIPPREDSLQEEEEGEEESLLAQEGIPIIDLEGVTGSRRKEIVGEIGRVLETWGFFQVVNHGVPLKVMDEMIEGVRRFNEGSDELKMEFYSREEERRVTFNSNFDLYKARSANWRDTLTWKLAPGFESPLELPHVCRDIMMEYSTCLENLGDTLFELLSEVLGLQSNYLKELGSTEARVMLSHYYPPCPEPDLTLGSGKHSDNSCLTLLLQDQIGGLQVLHQDRQWYFVPPVHGALVVNIGDMLQLITNDKFKSVVHRVLANRAGPRISVAYFFFPGSFPSPRLYGPIKELLSEDNPPIYRETTTREYITYCYSEGLGCENYGHLGIKGDVIHTLNLKEWVITLNLDKEWVTRLHHRAFLRQMGALILAVHHQ